MNATFSFLNWPQADFLHHLTQSMSRHCQKNTLKIRCCFTLITTRKGWLKNWSNWRLSALIVQRQLKRAIKTDYLLRLLEFPQNRNVDLFLHLIRQSQHLHNSKMHAKWSNTSTRLRWCTKRHTNSLPNTQNHHRCSSNHSSFKAMMEKRY